MRTTLSSPRSKFLDHLEVAAREIWVFGLKQANAALFGGLLLGFMLVTTFVDLPWLHRYDAIFVYAIAVQIVLLVGRLETPREMLVIFGFHLVATVMEIYKTSEMIGSWHYPEPAVIALWNVPLFAGFMYSAVGSYIARAWKVLDLRFANYPPMIHTYALAILIYVNFFTHHFALDIRYGLVAYAALIFWNTRIRFTALNQHSMPLLLGFTLVSLFVWIAENLATFANVWLYPSQQAGWTIVSPNKLGAWFLLMIVSFVLVSLLHRRQLNSAMRHPSASPFATIRRSASLRFNRAGHKQVRTWEN
ncbi:MAG: DUF817 domain-containing protein [Rhizobiaceae bacterium]